MKGDNNLLLALALMERIRPQLKDDKREQLTRENLITIQRLLAQVLARIGEGKIVNVYILGNIISASDLIDTLLSSLDYYETDSETKRVIADKILSSLEDMYLEVGKYYVDRDFDYTIKLDNILNRIVDNCIRRGYYFGEEV